MRLRNGAGAPSKESARLVEVLLGSRQQVKPHLPEKQLPPRRAFAREIVRVIGSRLASQSWQRLVIEGGAR